MIPTWQPRTELSRKEQFILKRVGKTRKLIGFLRLNRSAIFDAAFQAELAGMYRGTGAGAEPLPPAFLCMVMLLQAYFGTSDAEAVECALLDARWGMVLDCLDADEPVFSQGALVAFRGRLLESGMDKRLLERTAEVARQSGGFDYKKLPSLCVAVDSRPLAGAGKVEDTFNLLGHAAKSMLRAACLALKMDFEDVCRKARTPLLMASSIKAALDIDWNDKEAKDNALVRLTAEVDRAVRWLEGLPCGMPAASTAYAQAVADVRRQDLNEKDGVKMITGVAPERRISVEDSEMRHGRKSKTKRFDGFKQHVAVEVETGIALAASVTAANRPEEEGVPSLCERLATFGPVTSVYLDRAYIHSQIVEECTARGGEVVCKPWSGRNPNAELFGKSEFRINVRKQTITCPAGQTEQYEPGETVEFDPDTCGACPLRNQCTKAAAGRGRTVSMAEDEATQAKLRKLQTTRAGRAKLRSRTVVEHTLAHLSARQGPRARYRGVRKNELDVRRTLAVSNLHIAMRAEAAMVTQTIQ